MTCLRAPEGWFCTRKAGHAGGCALVKRAPVPLSEVDMARTPCPPAIPPTDPRLLTCCLAIADDGRVCHDTKGHDGPHDWELP